MAVEIERRWLVSPKDIPAAVLQRDTQQLTQGYLSQLGTLPVVRVRLVDAGGVHSAIQTVKAARDPCLPGMEEIEFPIPMEAGQALLDLCLAKLEKQRIAIPHGDGLIELDIFSGNQWLDGLCIAEIEVPAMEHPVAVPAWFGPEITGIRSLSNVALAYTPMHARHYANAVWAEQASAD